MKKMTGRSFSILIMMVILSLAACNAESGETASSSATSEPEALPTDTAEPIATDTAEPLPTDTAEPLPTDTAEPLPTDTAEPLPTDTAEPLPTDTAEPLPADTAEPLPTDTPEPLPTDTPVPLPTATRRPPLPTATVDSSVALLWPVYGEYKNPFLFKWIGSRDDTYQVTLRNRDQGHVINSGPISAIDWIVDIPAEQFGNWEWYVTNSRGTQSEVWTFVFQPHTKFGSGSDPGGPPIIAPPSRDP